MSAISEMMGAIADAIAVQAPEMSPRAVAQMLGAVADAMAKPSENSLSSMISMMTDYQKVYFMTFLSKVKNTPANKLKKAQYVLEMPSERMFSSWNNMEHAYQYWLDETQNPISIEDIIVQANMMMNDNVVAPVKKKVVAPAPAVVEDELSSRIQSLPDELQSKIMMKATDSLDKYLMINKFDGTPEWVKKIVSMMEKTKANMPATQVINDMIYAEANIDYEKFGGQGEKFNKYESDKLTKAEDKVYKSIAKHMGMLIKKGVPIKFIIKHLYDISDMSVILEDYKSKA